MNPKRLTAVCLTFASALLICASNSTAIADNFAAQFSGKSYIEIKDSAGVLNLNDDFTIEVWAKWRNSERYEMIAGDEAWPEMSKELKVSDECGWTLRKHRVKERDCLEFAVGAEKGGWLGVLAPLPGKMEGWSHIAVCRAGGRLTLYLNGKRVKSVSVEGRKLLQSPTPMYLGARKHAYKDRNFEGLIRGFRVSAKCRYTKDFKPPQNFEKDEQTQILFNFADSPADFVADESGNGRDGVLDRVELVPRPK